jgi:hypothetical protein
MRVPDQKGCVLVLLVFSYYIYLLIMSIVTLFVDTSDEKVSSERRFDKSLTISQLKVNDIKQDSLVFFHVIKCSNVV